MQDTDKHKLFDLTHIRNLNKIDIHNKHIKKHTQNIPEQRIAEVNTPL